MHATAISWARLCVVRAACVLLACVWCWRGAGVCDAGECGGGRGVAVVNVALVSAACRAMARCGARRLRALGCRRGCALARRSIAGLGRIVAPKAAVRLWVWCGTGERGLESDGAPWGASGRGAGMRARGVIGSMRDALGRDGGGCDGRRRDCADLCSMTRKQESGWRGAWADRWMRA
jgi:hypothetical protein